MDLILITNAYPYYPGEEFIVVETDFLSRAFEKVWVIPLYPPEKDQVLRPMPPNFKLIADERLLKASTEKFSLSEVSGLLLLGLKLGWREPKFLPKMLRNYKFLLTDLHYIARCEQIFQEIFEKYKLQNTLVYSYWMAMSICGIGRLRDRGLFWGKMVSRVHRSDLYHEHKPTGYLPFKSYQLQHLERLYSISEVGRDYLSKIYPSLSDRIRVGRLGVKGVDSFNPGSSDDVLRIVSCSFLIPIKRVDLILKAVEQFSRKVRWTHFGGGPELDALKKAAANQNPDIEISFPGHTSASEIEVFYQTQPVDLIVNVSTYEGIPVTIMETIRFGIPAVAANVGAMAEIVLPESGFLLEDNPTVASLHKAWNTYLAMNPDEKKAMRMRAKEVWSDRYNSEKNYPEFINELKKLASPSQN